MSDPAIEALQALHGKIYAMLTPSETATLTFFIAQGRKHGVSVVITPPERDRDRIAELLQSASHAEADALLRSVNSVVNVHGPTP